ncbi:OFA family MFS transporter [Photobacterium rosenbergii]|uniref:OFA family MFS transporter n=1 Tax=Photobacterium rosenbergii TaxID=294936 RepID=A0ABU3ZHT3_9GAMM|nr:OFA family MFS transporter [Photobacterium rosenbergii]MDV5169683.1 OFA family MFS transporter [Photobacterium rosenbergii]
MNNTKATRVLGACCGINLCIGILYAWSVFKNAFIVELGWSNTHASLPYTLSIGVLALAVLAAGIIQDKIGPRKVLIAGTFLAGIGLLLSGLHLTPMMLTLTFGLLTGCGIGFGYACLNPVAMKWFHPSRKGWVNGLIATAFGIASVYLAPLVSFMIAQYGISTSFYLLGSALLLIALPLACTIDNPPSGYLPPAPVAKSPSDSVTPQSSTASVNNITPNQDTPWRAMIRQPRFYMLWVMYAFSSTAGLMVIANITSIASVQADIHDAAYLVVALALFNSGGRLATGVLSDRIGALPTLTLAFVLQGLNMLLFSYYQSGTLMIVGAGLAGVGYGALLAVFPSLMAQFYGLKYYGTNYGILYTAWGMGGFIGPMLAALVVDSTGSYQIAYQVCAVLMAVTVGLALWLQPSGLGIIKPVLKAKHE